MKIRFLFIASILFNFSFLLHAASFDPAVDSKVFSCVARTPLQARILTSTDSLGEEKKGMVASFLKAYEAFNAEDLFGSEAAQERGGGEFAKQSVLEEAFQEEIDALGTPGILHVRLETQIGELVGYFSLEDWDIYSKRPENFPSHSIYVRQFYVLPSFQGQGVGKVAMSTLLQQLVPSAQHIYIATRRVNEPAKALYESLGFKERSDSLHGLSPHKYISYERHLGSSLN